MTAKIVLVATLLVTSVALADVVRRDELSPDTAAAYLLLFTALFLVRVAGQVVVALRAPAWLPPMNEWNLVPYRLLLPIQVVFIAVMATLTAGLASGSLAEERPGLGRVLIGVGILYAGSMAVRYAVRMRRRPEQRWFGGAIPIVFHIVLAGFLLTLGSYHADD